MPKVMVKDGITRTVADSDYEKFKDLGFKEVGNKIELSEDKEKKETTRSKKNYD